MKNCCLTATMMDSSLGGVCTRTHSSLLSCVQTWNRGNCGTPQAETQQTRKEKKEKTMATRCCHIRTITKHSMQNETLIEHL